MIKRMLPAVPRPCGSRGTAGNCMPAHVFFRLCSSFPPRPGLFPHHLLLAARRTRRFVDPGPDFGASRRSRAILIRVTTSALLIPAALFSSFSEEFLAFSSASRKNFARSPTLRGSLRWRTIHSIVARDIDDIDDYVLELPYERTRSVNIINHCCKIVREAKLLRNVIIFEKYG